MDIKTEGNNMKPENPYKKDSLAWKVFEGYWEDLDTKEIAYTLNESPEAIRAAIGRIKRETGYIVKRKKVDHLDKLAVYNDLLWIGKKFGRLTVIEPIRKELKSGNKRYLWRVKCDCGEERIVWPNNILKGGTISCGCYKREKSEKSRNGLTREEYRKEYFRKYKKEEYEWKRSHNLCVRCGGKDAYTINGRSICAVCSEKARRKGFDYIEEEIDKEVKIDKNERISYGLCSRCGKNQIKEGLRPWVNVPYKVCEDCYQHCLRMREAFKKKYGEYGIRYIIPPTSKTKKAIDVYRELLKDQKKKWEIYKKESWDRDGE